MQHSTSKSRRRRALNALIEQSRVTQKTRYVKLKSRANGGTTTKREGGWWLCEGGLWDSGLLQCHCIFMVYACQSSVLSRQVYCDTSSRTCAFRRQNQCHWRQRSKKPRLNAHYSITPPLLTLIRLYLCTWEKSRASKPHRSFLRFSHLNMQHTRPTNRACSFHIQISSKPLPSIQHSR